MTETGFVPGQMRTAEPEVADEAAESNSRRPLLLALGGVAVLAVVAIVAWLLFFSGSDDSTATPVASAPGSSAQPVVPSTAPSPVAPTKPGTSARLRHGFRDPFKALIVPAAATGSTGAAAATTAGGATTAAASTTSTDTTTGTTATGSTGIGTTTPSTAVAHKFQVVKVAASNGSVNVKVDGKLHKNLKAGEVFAKYFKVRFIGGNSNSFQFGDDVFTVVGSKAISVSS
jgi:hypothetical protein